MIFCLGCMNQHKVLKKLLFILSLIFSALFLCFLLCFKHMTQISLHHHTLDWKTYCYCIKALTHSFILNRQGAKELKENAFVKGVLQLVSIEILRVLSCFFKFFGVLWSSLEFLRVPLSCRQLGLNEYSVFFKLCKKIF